MERIIDKKYKILSSSNQELEKRGFLYDKEQKNYIYKFPVLLYKKSPVLKCIITVEEENYNVKIDVCGTDNNYYAPFYGNKYGDYEKVIRIIDRRIFKEFKKLKIVEFKIS